MRSITSGGVVATLFLGITAVLQPASVSGQICTWGGTSTLDPPAVVVLRSLQDGLRAPGRLATDSDANLYTTDASSGRVVVRNPSGRVILIQEGLGSPSGIAVGLYDDIYVGEQDSGSVLVFDRSFQLLDRLGAGTGEFLIPTDIAIDPLDGSIFVADGGANAIKVYSPSGALLHSFGGYGSDPGQLDFPSAVYVSADGEVFVGDQNHARIQIYDRDGVFLRCFGSQDSRFERLIPRVQGLTGDSLGRIYVADSFLGNVTVFDAQGGQLATIGELGERLGELRTPVGLVVDPFNRLFVASMNNGRVEVFGLDDFEDPPDLLAAVVTVDPQTLNRQAKGKTVMVYIEIRGTQLELVIPASIAANGVFAEPRRSKIGDVDADFVPDLMVRVDRAAVLDTLADGAAAVIITGELADGSRFEGSAEVLVIDRGQGGGK